jgi:peptidoglycan/xylan/chitin deacetylase (PgdA/CDA1 family)
VIVDPPESSNPLAVDRRQFLGMVAALGVSAVTARHVLAQTTAAPAIEIVHGPRTSKHVALTFHGAGDIGLAKAILAEAEKVHAPLTIFAIGAWLAQHPTMAKRITAGHHELANHTMNHLPMRLMDEPTAYTQFSKAAAVIKRTSGSIGHYARPSGTPHGNTAVRRAARRAGYTHVISYDVDSLDYTDPGANAVVRNVLNHVKGGSIVSLHLGHSGTVTALPRILTGLHSHGLTPVTVSQLLKGAS